MPTIAYNYPAQSHRIRVPQGVRVQVRVDRAEPDWQIKKRYRFNPLTGTDQPYNPDYYADLIRKGSIEGAKIQNWNPEDGVRIRAIQTMLHLQTNYNMLLRQGLYRQPAEQVQETLLTWYLEIARDFPRYADTCRFEYVRHLTNFQRGLGHDFQYVTG